MSGGRSHSTSCFVPAAALALALASAEAAAEDPPADPLPPAALEGAGPSPGLATVLSHAGLVVPIVISTRLKHEDRDVRANAQFALVAGGIVAGPALGYLAGGVSRRAARGLVGRSLCATAATAAYLILDDSSGLGYDLYAFAAIGVAAAGAAGVWALWDAARVAPIVEENNRTRRDLRIGFGFAASPGGAPGIAATLAF